jgi:hypothetical protein
MPASYRRHRPHIVKVQQYLDDVSSPHATSSLQSLGRLPPPVFRNKQLRTGTGPWFTPFEIWIGRQGVERERTGRKGGFVAGFIATLRERVGCSMRLRVKRWHGARLSNACIFAVQTSTMNEFYRRRVTSMIGPYRVGQQDNIVLAI